MQLNEKKLIETLEMTSFTKLSEKLGVTRGTLYYHYDNFKKRGKITFTNAMVKKIGLSLFGDENIFFEN